MTLVYDDLGDATEGAAPVRRIKFTVNGQKKIAEVEPRLLLAHLIRRGLGLRSEEHTSELQSRKRIS